MCYKNGNRHFCFQVKVAAIPVEEKEEPFLILLSAYWRFTSYSVNCPCYSTDFISKCSFERKRAFLSSKIDDADE